MNHTQLALLDELLAGEILKRHDNGWLIGDAEDEEVVNTVTELAAADQAEMRIQAGTIGIRFSETIRQYIEV
jgi:hypothetical protein